ncbi:MAG: c-type cytochrome [Acidobacteriota bacterium]|nr:c-type cytochrome [Acidobacteriota bacterium]
MKSQSTLLLSVALLSFAGTAFSQIGDRLDRPDLKQELRVPRELIPPAPVLSPEEALRSFVVEPGFRIELVAAEPLIEDPVAIAFDPDGRIWVVEMRGYMHDVDGRGEDLPNGRVVFLEDTDGDGRMDKSTVFLDGVVMPRSIALVGDGVLVGAPPYLRFYRDTNGDGRADERTLVADDYGVAVIPERPEVANAERAPSELMWSLDNWIRVGEYIAKFRYDGEGFVRAPSRFRGQWGLTQDDWGRVYYNSNSSQLRGDHINADYFDRNPHFANPRGVNVLVAEDQRVWPIRVTPGVNRGYQPGILRDDGTLNAFTAACAPTIFRGHMFPADYYGNAFVAEPAAHLVKRNYVVENADGSIRASHAYEGREFLASTDERFRPVDLATGPDGALYVVDLYRGILQHRISLTTYLRRQILERGLDQPIGLGRIYRIVPEGAPVPAERLRPRFSAGTPAQWVKHLSHPNGWWRQTAQRLLVERTERSVAPELRRLAVSGSDPRARLHALWTLDGLNEIDLATLRPALSDEHHHLRAAAVRLHERWLHTEQHGEAARRITSLRQDPSAFVRVQVAFSTGNIRSPENDRLLADMVQAYPGDAYLADASLSGLHGRELELLTRLVSDRTWMARRHPAANRLLQGLASSIIAEQNTSRIIDLFALLEGRPSEVAQLLVEGASQGITGARMGHLELPTAPKALLALLRDEAPASLRAAAARLERFVLWPDKAGAEPLPRPLTVEESRLFGQGRTLYNMTCAACHQGDGGGLEGVAPPLAGVDWVTGPADRSARILLHGLSGPVDVLGKTYNLEMPAVGFMVDDQIASVLTYIRRAWGHGADPVSADFVSTLRQKYSTRERPWSAAELREQEK